MNTIQREWWTQRARDIEHVITNARRKCLLSNVAKFTALLASRLRDLADSLPLYVNAEAGGSATSRVRAFRKYRKALGKSIVHSPSTLPRPASPVYELLVWDFAWEINPKNPENFTEEARASFERALIESPSAMMDKLDARLKQAIAEQKEHGEAIRAKAKTTRSSNFAFDLVFMELLAIYREVFGRGVRLSKDEHDKPSGPLIRYMGKCFALLGMPAQTPDGIRNRVKKLENLRKSGHPNYS